MNLEKYKKFLDGLGTLRGICEPWWGEAERLQLQLGPTICHRSPIGADRELPARPGGAAGFPGRGGASTAPLHFPLLSSPWIWSRVPGHKGALGQRPAQP